MESGTDNDPKLYLGMTWPRAHHKVTSIEGVKRGNDPRLHLGMTWPRHHKGPRPIIKSHPSMESGTGP
eukprot:12418956-Karenia_brevis.AAC.1